MFALGAGLLLFNLITRRLRRLTTVVEDFQRRDFVTVDEMSTLLVAHRTERRRGDELDRLDAAFSALAKHIRQQMQTLQHTDALRRELVANVSHDLRTPLAALHGYLETLLLKESQLTAQERHHYLAIAARHSTHLGKLVSEFSSWPSLKPMRRRSSANPSPYTNLRLMN